MKMLNDIIKVEPRGGYRLWLQFQDGVEGEVVRVNPELGTICWPNDADWGSACALLARDRAADRNAPGRTAERQRVIRST